MAATFVGLHDFRGLYVLRLGRDERVSEMGLSTLNMTISRVGHAPTSVFDLMWTCKLKGIMDTKNLLNGPYKNKNQVEVEHKQHVHCVAH
jgi:hypothetical protein